MLDALHCACSQPKANEGNEKDDTAGGLRIFLKQTPPDWGFSSFNQKADKIYDFLKSDQGGENLEVVVPYRMNRAVIFHSQLFHTTDHFRFRCCRYDERRINLTMLFGIKNDTTFAGSGREVVGSYFAALDKAKQEGRRGFGLPHQPVKQ